MLVTRSLARRKQTIYNEHEERAIGNSGTKLNEAPLEAGFEPLTSGTSSGNKQAKSRHIHLYLRFEPLISKPTTSKKWRITNEWVNPILTRHRHIVNDGQLYGPMRR